MTKASHEITIHVPLNSAAYRWSDDHEMPLKSNLQMRRPSIAMERMIVGGGCFGALKALTSKFTALNRPPAYAGVRPSSNLSSGCSGTTGHAEVVEVQFDPTIISYETLLEYFFFTVHATRPNSTVRA